MSLPDLTPVLLCSHLQLTSQKAMQPRGLLCTSAIPSSGVNSHQDPVCGEQPDEARETRANTGLHVHSPFMMINSSITGQDVSIYLWRFFGY